MTIRELNEFMYEHGFCNTNNEEDLQKKYVADLVESAMKDGYNKAIDEFYDKALNFEDYIEPIDTSENGAILLYSGKDITNVIVKIKEELKGARE